jgi:hypothetical protein
LERKDVWGPSAPLQSPDDEKILQYAVELFRQLGATKPEPDSVVWDDKMNSDLITVRYGEIKLPRSMMGRLTAEDWKPLLAPALIYNYVLLRDERRYSFIHMLLPLLPGPIFVAFALLALFRYGRGPFFPELALTINILYLAYIGIALWWYIRGKWRRLFYAADQQAAKLLGKETFLESLAKYGETVSATGYPRKRLHLSPTVGQRIDRLQTALPAR